MSHLCQETVHIVADPAEMSSTSQTHADPPSSPSSSSSRKHLTEAQKRHRRLRRNRGFAKEARNRNKAKLDSLESQFKQLSEEANRLKAERMAIEPAILASAFHRDQTTFVKKVGEMLGSAETTDAQINAVIEEAMTDLGVGGTLHAESLKDAFTRTIEMMIPEQILLALLLSQRDVVPEFRARIESSLGAGVHAACLRYLRQETPLLKDALSSFKSVAEEIGKHVQALNTLLMGLRPILSARQCAQLVQWLHKHYVSLSPEKVLNYGHNSMELLNAS